MKTLIFSDTHLSLPFEEKKYNFMRGIIEPADRVIINGDFWEGHLIKFEQFIHSPWKNLFPLLKQKNTIYIYGNHDEELMTDKRVQLFSDEQFDKYEIQLKRKKLIVEHGDRLAYLPHLGQFFTKRSSTFEKVMTRKTGSKFHKMVGGRLNKKIK
jgi:UDP-2,3-diacylglucosamine pyrophosphatase LpxH